MKAGKKENIVAVQVEGPSRVGHYFRPVMVMRDGTRFEAQEGPVIVPDGKEHAWSLSYEPGKVFKVTLDGKEARVEVPVLGKDSTQVDRFGLFTGFAGGSEVRMFVKDLKYTAK